MSEILWSPGPDRIAGTNITRFTAMVRERHGMNADDYAALHRWSIENRAAFWSAVWDYGEVIGDRGDGPILIDGDRMPGAKWFPGARLNFAENLLRRCRRRPCNPVPRRGSESVARSASVSSGMRCRCSRRHCADAVLRRSVRGNGDADKFDLPGHI